MASESEFLTLLRTLPLHPGARELGDDCAILELGGETLILTHDAMAEGTHFRAEGDMADVAWKLVATNLSDLAAKGAEPLGIMLSYMLGKDDARFIVGLCEALDAFGIGILGGDTVRGAGPRSFGMTAIGRATHTPVPSRAGARPGDQIYVAGTIGAAMLGFDALQTGGTEHHSADMQAFLRPTPLLVEGKAIAPLATAMMDVSDGLLLDAGRMANASKVTFAILSADVPYAGGLTDPQARSAAIGWGDDYALLFTLPGETQPPVTAQRIGKVQARGSEAILLDQAPIPAAQQRGYTH